MTSHEGHRHPRTREGRAACRKAGGDLPLIWVRAHAAHASAPCEQCFWNATSSAYENLEDAAREAGTPIDDLFLHPLSWIEARDYLYDRSALSACTDHSHLC